MSLEQNGLSDVDWDWGKLIAVLTRSIQLVSIFPPNIAGTKILIRANRHSFPPLCVFYSLVQTPFPPLPSLPSLAGAGAAIPCRQRFACAGSVK